MLPLTHKPRIQGIQTAKVVGKKGEEKEEISTDENAHIWVQFFWDREPKKSCPVRVAHAWSANKWGTQFIPRIGMEVVVEFLEGDPDRPLVTGCVYNGDNKTPYDLPNNKTQSGTKSDSSKGHNGYNEFMFEDKKGSEFIRMHAEKDHLVTINANQTGSVGAVSPDSPSMGGDQTWTVGGNRSWKIQKGNDSLEIDLGSRSISIPTGGQFTTAGFTIVETVGMTVVRLTPLEFSVEALQINKIAQLDINQTAGVSINLTAPIINLTGAVLINGMVPVLIPV
jgi:type VI secretion system secreted protein VgrG